MHRHSYFSLSRRAALLALASILLLLFWESHHEAPPLIPLKSGPGTQEFVFSQESPVGKGTAPADKTASLPLVEMEREAGGSAALMSRRLDDGSRSLSAPLKASSFRDLKSIPEGAAVPLDLPDGRQVVLRVNYSRADAGQHSLWLLGGTMADNSGSFYVAQDLDQSLISGWVVRWNDPQSWVFTQRDGQLYLEETPTASIVCVPAGRTGLSAPLPGDAITGAAASSRNVTRAAGGAVPVRSSRPSATSVLYLDFEAGTVTSPFWNGGQQVTYEDAGLDTPTMEEIWARLSENYVAFDVNVTTERAKYTNAPIGRRMRMVVTQTSWMANGPLGIAGVGAFPNAGGFSSLRNSFVTNTNWDPNWRRGVGVSAWTNPPEAIVFPTDMVGWTFVSSFYGDHGQPTGTLAKNELAWAMTHELGHTLGLAHDSTSEFDPSPGTYTAAGEYYMGHGSAADTWGSVMGGAFRKNLVQFSKGEYSNAINRVIAPLLQDDVAVIGSSVSGGGLGLVNDDGKGDTQAAAALLSIGSGGVVSDKGIVFSETDVDVFRIPITASGYVNLDITPAPGNRSLDVYAELQNSSGGILQTSSLVGEPHAKIITSSGPLAAGNYFLLVRGSTKDPAGTGWTRYGNTGTYSITGSVNGSTGTPIITASGLPPAANTGIVYTYPLGATNNPTSYYLVSGTVPPGLLLSNGSLTGTPTQPGWYNFTLAAANAQGGSTKFFILYVYGPADLNESLDNYVLEWTTRSLPSSTAAATLWQGQRSISNDGTDAARSGTSGANSDSILETQIRGPGRLTYYWRTSSAVGDRLIFNYNNTDQYNITGESAWEQRSVNIALGTHTAQWIYRTDPGTTAGQNAGFVDRVVYVPAPYLGATFYVAGIINQPLTRQVGPAKPLEVSEAPPVDSYAITSGNLPPGMTLNTATGLISGTPTALGSFECTISATNAGGTTTVSPTVYIYPAMSLQEATDAAGLTWVTGGANPWFGDTALTRDGLDAAHSGPIRHNQSSHMQTTVTGPGNLSFWWKCSTDPSEDPLIFSIDGVAQNKISGEVDWTQRFYTLTSGQHILKWDYTRDGNGNGVLDMAWVDQVSWTTPGPVITNPLTVNWTCGGTYTVSLTADDPNVTWSMSGVVPPDMAFLDTSKVIVAVPKLPRTVSFTIIATNSAGTSTSRQFTAVIESSYAAWARNRGLGVGSEGEDLDKDGITNIAELAFALDPNVPNFQFQPVTFDRTTGRLKAIFRRRHQYFPDLKYEVQVSGNLQNWSPIAYLDNGVGLTNNGAASITETTISGFPDPVQEVTLVDGVPHSAANPRRYMRVRVSQQ